VKKDHLGRLHRPDGTIMSKAEIEVLQTEPDPDDTVIIDAEIVGEEDEQTGELVVFDDADPYPILTSVVEQLFDEYDRSQPVAQRVEVAFDRLETIRAMFETGNIYPELAKPIAEDTMIKFDLAAAHG
jgi:hypothetical protein